MPHVDAVVKKISQDAGGQWPFAAVLVNNRPHVYGQPDEPDPAKQFAVIRPHSSPIPMDVLDSLVRAVTQNTATCLASFLVSSPTAKPTRLRCTLLDREDPVRSRPTGRTE
jgi:hypothetical protein